MGNNWSSYRFGTSLGQAFAALNPTTGAMTVGVAFRHVVNQLFSYQNGVEIAGPTTHAQSLGTGINTLSIGDAGLCDMKFARIMGWSSALGGLPTPAEVGLLHDWAKTRYGLP